MADGFFLGGLGQGLAKGFGTVRNIQQNQEQIELGKGNLALQKERLAQQKVREAREIALEQFGRSKVVYDQNVKHFDNIFSEEGGRNNPQAKKALELIQASGESLAKNLKIDPAIARASFESLLSQETPDEISLREAKQAARKKGLIESATQAEKPPITHTLTNPKTGEQIDLDLREKDGVKMLHKLQSEGFISTKTSVAASSVKDLKVSKTEVEKFRTGQIVALNVLDEISRVEEQLDTGAITGLTGRVITGIDSLAGNLRSVAEAFDKPDKEGVENPGSYDFSGFESNAVESIAFRSNMIGLAYSVARAKEPLARNLSVSDVQNAMDRLALGSGSPQQIRATLAEVKLQIKQNMANTLEVMQRDNPNLSLVERLAGTPVKPGVSTDQPKTNDISDDDLDKELQRIFSQ